MIITKEFEGEMAHIVRNCSTERCRSSIHGHSFKVLVSLTASAKDKGQMLMDFGLMKTTIKSFIDSFDHCTVLWKKDYPEYINDVKKWSDRWIILPVSPSAEMLSLYMLYVINKILKATIFNNGEKNVIVHSVQYYETRTGSATAFEHDMCLLPVDLKAEFSEGVQKDWPIELRRFFAEGMPEGVKYFENPKIEKQV